jgi:hypothetical protein
MDSIAGRHCIPATTEAAMSNGVKIAAVCAVCLGVALGVAYAVKTWLAG